MIEVNTMSALASQAQTYADWLLMKRFCDQIYGEDRAVKVEIETEGEYNDEGGTNYHLTELTAYDEDGDELEYDLSLPFWKLDVVREVLKSYNEDEGEGEGIDPDNIQEALREMYWPSWDKEHTRPDNLVLWEDFSIDADSDIKYDLTQPPESPLLEKYGIL